jgi:hypothetical protein
LVPATEIDGERINFMPSFEGNIEIDSATNPVVVAHRILEERVKGLSQELPGVTFG